MLPFISIILTVLRTCCFIIFSCLNLAPSLIVSLVPTSIIGNAREESIELQCRATVAENIIEDSYIFGWMKDGSRLQSVDQRIVV